MNYYHGTNVSNPDALLDSIKMSPSISGYGLYLTTCLKTAKKYGRNVCVFDMPNSFNVDRTSPIDKRYIEDISLMSECIAGGIESVITSQQTLNQLLLNNEDCFVI